MERKKRETDGFATSLFLLICLLLLVAGVFFLNRVNFYQIHFFKGTIVNGIDISKMTLNEVISKFDEEAKNYSLTIIGRDHMTETYTSNDFNYGFYSDGTLETLLRNQNPYEWPFAPGERVVNYDIGNSYDQGQLEKLLKNSIFVDKTYVIAPQNATLSYSDTDGYQIVPEVKGTTVRANLLRRAVTAAINSNQNVLYLEDSDVYTEPKITSESKKLKQCMNLLNRCTDLTITIEFGDRTEILDSSIIHNWIIYDEDHLSFQLDKQKIQEYVNELGSEYDTFSSTRFFTTHAGKTIQIDGGNYGWQLDRIAQAKDILNAIKTGKDTTLTPTYSGTAASFGNDDIGSSYVEVNLKKQKLWVYKNGKEKLSSDLVSGDKNMGYQTPTGVYAILYKTQYVQLYNEIYDAIVNYWIPFSDNCGINDATWRKKFGGKIYKKNGSLGNLNVPLKKAKKIYELVDSGMPVIIYK